MAGKKNRSYMTIEPAPRTFTDKRLDPAPTPGDPAEKVVTPTAKPGGSMSPIQRSINIPRTNPMRSA
jgi:hypothetical protein